MTIQSPQSIDTTLLQDGQFKAISAARMRVVNDTANGSFTATQTASYTLTLGDYGSTIVMNLSSDGTLTIPTNASVAFDIGTIVEVVKAGVGKVNIVWTFGTTTLLNPGSWTMTKNNSRWRLHKVATDTWRISGNEPRLVMSDYCTSPTTYSGGADASGVIAIWGNSRAGSQGANGTFVDSTRIVTSSTGGPNNGPYRTFTAQSGDAFGSSGYRCQVGKNENRNGWGYNSGIPLSPSSSSFTNTTASGTFHLYNEGDHKITEFDFRIGGAAGSWNINFGTWQNIAQIKYSQPTGFSGSPQIEFSQYAGNWYLVNDPGTGSVFKYQTPAVAGDVNAWMHCKIDAYFSQFSSVGWCQLQFDKGASSRLFFTNMIAETASTNRPIGTSVPNFFAAGIYTNTTNTFPISVDLANIEIWDAG